jgi:hypothetical protein
MHDMDMKERNKNHSKMNMSLHLVSNIYGLVALDSQLLTYVDRSEEFPSTRLDKLPEPPSAEYAQCTS